MARNGQGRAPIAASERHPRLREAWLAAALWAAASAAFASENGLPSGKTLARLHDPVIVSGSLLESLRDRETDRYRLYAFRSGNAEPIPFQFDERDGDGDIVFPESGDAPSFRFGANDELVFMARDTGERRSDPGGATPTAPRHLS